MEQFRWGPEFLRINAELLAAYAAATSSEGVLEVQNTWMRKLEAEAALRHSRARELPPSDDSDADEGGGGAEREGAGAAATAEAGAHPSK